MMDKEPSVDELLKLFNQGSRKLDELADEAWKDHKAGRTIKLPDCKPTKEKPIIKPIGWTD